MYGRTHTECLNLAVATAHSGLRGANPLVGAVLLSPDGRIATGFHRDAGTPHAEVQALRAARAENLCLPDCVLYVTLEPCLHSGRTGPCVAAILEAGIRHVIYACPDPNPRAAGGARELMRAGLRVERVEHAQARALNARWLGAREQARPFVSLKLAQSLDGCQAAQDASSQWISSAGARQHAQSLRARVAAIIVGTGTALADNPRLSARHPDGTERENQPRPVVLGARSLPESHHLACNPHTLRRSGTDLPAVLRELMAAGCEHVLVEGGPTLAGSFMAADLVDELLVYQAPVILGPGLRATGGLEIAEVGEALRWELDDTGPDRLGLERIGPDVLWRLRPDSQSLPPSRALLKARASSDPAPAV